MKVEFVGLSATHGYIHNETTDLKKLAKQIKDETGVATDIQGDNLIVAGNVVPVGIAVVIKGGGASTLSVDAFESQYREIIDFDTAALDTAMVKLDKRVSALEAPKPKAETKAEPKAEPKAETKAEPKADK